MKVRASVRLDLIFPLFMVVSCLLLRPTFLGEAYSNIGLVLTFGICVLFLVMKQKLEFDKHDLLQILLVVLTALYLFAHTVIVENPNIDIAIRTIIGLLVGFLSISIILTNKSYSYRFFNLFFYLLCIFSLSYLVSIILMLFIGIESTFWGTFDYNYFLDMSFFYPFTPIYGILNSGSFIAPRLAAFAREAGIAQAFFVWAFWWGYFTGKKRFLLVLNALGVVFTFSTAGIFIFFIVAVVFFLLNRYKIRQLIILFPVSLFLFVIGFYAFMYAPVVGLVEKSKTHGASIEYRGNALVESFNNVMNYPFGVGLNNGSLGSGAGVNLISSAQLIGLLGVALIVLQFILPKIVYYQKESFVLMLPFLITALLFQPIYDAPIVAIFLLSKKYEFNEPLGN